MNISKSDVNAGVEKAEEFVDDSADAITRGTSAAATQAKKAIRSTGEKIDRTIDANNETIDSTKRTAANAVSEVPHRSIDFIRDIFDVSSRGLSETLQHRRAQAQQLSEESLQKTVDYVQERPLRSILIAASVGAVAVLLLAGNRRH